MDTGRNGQLDGQMDVRRPDRRTQGTDKRMEGWLDRQVQGGTEGQLQLSVGVTGWGGPRTPHTHPAQPGGPGTPTHIGPGPAQGDPAPRGVRGTEGTVPPQCHRGTPQPRGPWATLSPSAHCHLRAWGTPRGVWGVPEGNPNQCPGALSNPGWRKGGDRSAGAPKAGPGLVGSTPRKNPAHGHGSGPKTPIFSPKTPPQLPGEAPTQYPPHHTNPAGVTAAFYHFIFLTQ